MKQNVFKSLYILSLLFSIIVVSCRDDFPYSDIDIPEGEGFLSATVTFTPTATTDLTSTRTPGDTISTIETLCVLVYDKGKNLVKKYTDSDLLDYEDTEYEVNPNDHLDGNEAHTDEKKTARATFKIPDLPYGQYYMFAVANMGDLSKYAEEILTVEGLQKIKLDWNATNIEKNNQMFGYFTSGSADSDGFESKEPIKFVGKDGGSEIHAWLKRVVSKVTVAFDPSGLNQGVSIYIKNVTVRDIPKTCWLGAENTPEDANDLYNHLDSYPDKVESTPVEVANSRLEYDSNGVITDPNEHTGSENTDGLRLDNSVRNAIPEDAHGSNAPSLFFFENNQNPYLLDKDINYKNNPKYNKKPQKDGDDIVGTTIHKPENDNDFKDRVPFGTYVEVEAYYVSTNPANPGEGPIKYRFMLGKDTSFDYDAQRNYHYKLTLGFNGWANDPDWHIDYVITNPDIQVPSVFRVSYLYQQQSELPIKIIGDIQYLTVTITENNWAPYDPNPYTNDPITLGSGDNAKEYMIPKDVIPSEPNTYQFQWNRAAFSNIRYVNPAPTGENYPDNLPQGQERPQFGFLALHLPSTQTTTISGGHSLASNNLLIDYWKNNLEGERRFYKGNEDFTIGEHPASWGDRGHSFPEEENKYKVNEILNDNGVRLENQMILMLPVWTRTKTLIEGSGFSGNNPYEAFERKAVIHIRGSFDVGGDEPEYVERDVEVRQVKRITNPKGVWRAHNRNNAFNVTLLEAVNSNAESDFQAFQSQGEWTAYIDEKTNAGGFTLRPNGDTNGYMKDGVIYGNTGSEIHFAIEFGGDVDDNQSECAVVNVKYHGNQCMHKILVRKGYNAPLRMGGTPGKQWSSFSLYQATNTNTTENGRQVFDAVLTKNPLMLGSMFRRGRIDQGIFVWNNMQPDLGPFKAPRNIPFVVGLANEGVTVKPGVTDNIWKNQWQEKSWSDIGFDDDANTAAGRNRNMGIFYALDDEGNRTTDDNNKPLKYRVPTYEEFKALTDNSEFGFGVFYGSEATEPKKKSEEAYGLIDPYNEGLFNIKNGMRAVVAYDKSTGNQILFPIGRYGIGTRRMYRYTLPALNGVNYSDTDYEGQLKYSDLSTRLTFNAATANTVTTGNLFRPIPYNIPIVSGCIYWIDQDVTGVHSGTGAATSPDRSCLGWDMNYFNFDFNPYTANNWQDACPIKFVIDEN
ncbi:MAG: hypothetical protein K2N35_06710 [Muribaculaceae bacterium]|nr:hypothetical protein [Muribaculaceae bacterium]